MDKYRKSNMDFPAVPLPRAELHYIIEIFLTWPRKTARTTMKRTKTKQKDMIV